MPENEKKEKVNPEKLKAAIKRFKEKQKQSKGKDSKESKGSKDKKDSKPKQQGNRDIESKKNPGSSKPVVVGPHGGEYVQADTGKKQYLQSEETRVYHRDAKKALDEDSIKDILKGMIEENNIGSFVTKFKLEKSEKFKSCVRQVMDSGKSESSAYAICTASLGNKEAHPASDKKKGKK